MATNTTPNEPTQGDTGSAANEGSVATADVPAIPMHAFSSIGVPQGLKNSAGTIWRVLVVLAVLAVAGAAHLGVAGQVRSDVDRAGGLDDDEQRQQPQEQPEQGTLRSPAPTRAH